MGDPIMPVQINGATSGSTTVQATDAVTATLTLPSSTGTLLSTANPQSGGVIQVVQGTTTTNTSSSSNTFIDTTLSATITPKFSTSKILILISHPENNKSGGNSNNDIGFQLMKNGSLLIQFNNDLGYSAQAQSLYFSTSFNYLDSPATTSALTYKTQFCSKNSNAASVSVQANSMMSTITLMEIAA